MSSKITYTKSAENIIFKALGYENRKGVLYHSSGELENLPIMYGRQPVKVKDILGFQKRHLILKVKL